MYKIPTWDRERRLFALCEAAPGGHAGSQVKHSFIGQATDALLLEIQLGTQQREISSFGLHVWVYWSMRIDLVWQHQIVLPDVDRYGSNLHGHVGVDIKHLSKRICGTAVVSVLPLRNTTEQCIKITKAVPGSPRSSGRTSVQCLQRTWDVGDSHLSKKRMMPDTHQ